MIVVSSNVVPETEEATVVNEPDEESLPVCFLWTRNEVNCAGAVHDIVTIEPSPAATTVMFVGGDTSEVASVVRVTELDRELSLPASSTALTR